MNLRLESGEQIEFLIYPYNTPPKEGVEYLVNINLAGGNLIGYRKYISQSEGFETKYEGEAVTMFSLTNSPGAMRAFGPRDK